jgi:hypothetical protein
MKKNMGNIDRIVRILIAVVAAYLFLGGVVTGTVGIILMLIAAIFLLTSLVSFCPLYTVLGISTCPAKKV